jgi:hypothetical protein
LGHNRDANPGVPAPPENASACARAGGSPGPLLFDRALCVCGDLVDAGTLHIGGDVGVNGRSAVANLSDVQGSWSTGDDFVALGALSIGGNLTSPRNVTALGLMKVGRDLSVGGILVGSGLMHVAGSVRAASELFLGIANLARRDAYAAPIGPPCTCDAAKRLDVQAEVAHARQTNDNARAGLPPSGIVALGVKALTLSGGRYYLGSLAMAGLTHLTIDGAVSAYIDGSLALIGAQQISLRAGSTLDLYVSGDVATAGAIDLGQGAAPGSFRLYVGGTGSVALNAGLQRFQGAIYAPTATVAYAGATAIDGALVVGGLAGAGLLSIDYVRPQQSSGLVAGSNDGATECQAPPTRPTPGRPNPGGVG